MYVKRLIFHLLFFALVYMFTFQLGLFRMSLYTKYGYIFTTCFDFLILLRFFFKKTAGIHLKKVLLFLFFSIQVLTIVSAMLNQTIFSGLILAGHQVMFIVFFIGIYMLGFADKNSFCVFFCNTMILLASISLFFALYGYFFGSFSLGPFIFQDTERSIFRLQGWYGSPNRFGPVLAVGILVLFYKINNTNVFSLSKNDRYFHMLLLPLFFLGLILTGSRGSWGSLIIAFVIFLYFQKDFIWIKPKKLINWFILAICVFIGTSLFLSKLGYDLDRINNELLRVDSIEYQLDVYRGGRMYYWKTTFDVITNSSYVDLIVGRGMGFLGGNIFGRSSHSGFLALIVDRGLLIFSIFMIFCLFIFKHMIRNKNGIKNFGALSASLLTFLLIKNTTNNDIPSSGFTGIIFIFLVVLTILQNSSNSNLSKTR